MLKSIETTGKTIDLAVKAAMEQLHLDRDSISVEVLENAKNGFLGFGSQPAKIRATYEAPDEPETPAAPKSALSSASRNRKPSKFAKQQAESAAVKQNTIKPAGSAASGPNPAARTQERSSKSGKPATRTEKPTPRNEKPASKSAQPKSQTPKPPKSDVQAPQTRTGKPNTGKSAEAAAPASFVPGGAETRINAFLEGLLEHMGSNAQVHTYQVDADTYKAELAGDNLGMLIGRRGDTLDAIQHLTNYSINRAGGHRLRINVDAENYREKREESLKRLAVKVAGKVVRYRRNITLEPMNAYERHVIHATLQDYADVTTYSTGSEPNRRIVVAYSKYKSLASTKQ